MAEQDNFVANYTELKKFSVLRSFLKEGIDVDEIYDPEEVDPEVADAKRADFLAMSVDDILLHFRKKILRVTQEFNTKSGRDSVKAGSEEAKKQKELWKETPNFGLSYASNYLTTITYGLRPRKFSVSSAGTGTGKTRLSVANICHSFVPRYYDEKLKCFVDNPHGKQNSALYIGTEMELIEEIEPILWAYISGVPQEHITQGTYLEGEEERVDKAIEILDKEGHIYLEYVPDYDISTLENIIEEHVVQHGVRHIFFDYIHITTDLISEFQAAAKARIQIREDQVLGNLSTKLKELCRKYDVSIDTWTQVTGDFKNEQNRDQTIVRGAKSIIDKVDTASITSRPTKKELKLLEPILRKMVYKNLPNLCMSVYKNRGAPYNQVKIWLYVDYDTMRVHDLFVTDYEYQILNIPQSFTEVIEDQKIRMAYSKEELENGRKASDIVEIHEAWEAANQTKFSDLNDDLSYVFDNDEDIQASIEKAKEEGIITEMENNNNSGSNDLDDIAEQTTKLEKFHVVKEEEEMSTNMSEQEFVF